MNNEQNKMLYEKLKPKENPYIHEWEFDNEVPKVCEKCGKGMEAFNILCSIPDKYPDSPADIAEEIRVWMEKADHETLINYAHAIQYPRSELNIAVMSPINWFCLGLNATPQQKINAAFKVWKG